MSALSVMEAPPVTTSAAAEETSKLRRHLGRLDLLCYLLCTLVGLDTIGAAAKNGAQGFTWLIALVLLFFIPYGLLAAELGSSFTEEGGAYVWTKLAFGRFVAAINAVFYWSSNPIWLGGALTISAIAAVDTFFWPLTGPARYGFALAFIWFTIATAILPVRIGKWISTVGAWLRVAVLGLFLVTVALYASRHGLGGFRAAEFLPTYAVFITVAPVLLFNFVGFEVPSSAGGEMENAQRDVPYTLAWSAAATILMYGLPVLAILVVLPKSSVTGLSGFLDAIKTVFTVYGGHAAPDGRVSLTGAGAVLGALAGGGFVVAVASSGATWIMGADRALAVACYDGAGPRALGRFSARFGTPLAANLLSGAVATVVMLLAFALAKGSAERYFAAVLGLAISTTTLSYLAVFPTVIRLRYTHPQTPRPYRIPGTKHAGAWICGSAATLWVLFATAVLIWPGLGVGWFGSPGTPDSSLPQGFQGERTLYELTQVVPLAVLFLMGVAFYWSGRHTRAHAAKNASFCASLAKPGSVPDPAEVNG